MTANVLVTDGSARAALATVRSLGRAGHRTWVSSTHDQSLAGASRHCHRPVRVPDPYRDRIAYAGTLARLVDDEDIDVLLPISEASLYVVLEHRDYFEDVAIPFPSLDRFRRASDKRLTLALAERAGLPVPRSRILESSTDIPAFDDLEFGFPLIVKPSHSVVHAGRGLQDLEVAAAADPGEVRELLDRLPAAAYPVLLQSRIAGRGAGVFLLRWDGRTVATFAHRRLREKPPSGGVSVYRESAEASPELVEAADRILQSVGWNGPAMVEFRRGRRDGTPWFMEVNARFWGSLQLALDSGVDFPAMLTDLALGRQIQPIERYRLQVRSRWVWGDVDHLIARLRGKTAGPDGGQGRWSAFLEFLKAFGPGNESEVFRLSDLRPFLLESRRWFRDASASLCRRLRNLA